MVQCSHNAGMQSLVEALAARDDRYQAKEQQLAALEQQLAVKNQECLVRQAACSQPHWHKGNPDMANNEVAGCIIKQTPKARLMPSRRLCLQRSSLACLLHINLSLPHNQRTQLLLLALNVLRKQNRQASSALALWSS